MKSMCRQLIKPREVHFNLVEVMWWRKLWRMQVHERFKIIIWKLLWNVIPTKGRMAVHICLSGILKESQCVLCGPAEETTKHLMLECMVSQIIWSNSPWC